MFRLSVKITVHSIRIHVPWRIIPVRNEPIKRPVTGIKIELRTSLESSQAENIESSLNLDRQGRVLRAVVKCPAFFGTALNESHCVQESRVFRRLHDLNRRRRVAIA